jgi:branched-subunit amino acid aminotransferase/4-amino-4-deoxychorismate lyase
MARPGDQTLRTSSAGSCQYLSPLCASVCHEKRSEAYGWQARSDQVVFLSSLFEGMKAYRTSQPGSKPLLFRPDMNMARMRRSADRVQLPVSCVLCSDILMFTLELIDVLSTQDFDAEAMIELIRQLVKLDEHLIPPPPNALYIRPTMFVQACETEGNTELITMLYNSTGSEHDPPWESLLLPTP